MRIKDVQAIDVHGHYGTYIAAKFQLENEFMTGNEQEVIRRARIANTKITVVSPLEALYPSYAGHVSCGSA